MRALLLLLVVCSAVACRSINAEEKAEKPWLVRRFPLNPLHANVGDVASVGEDGAVRIENLANPQFTGRDAVSGLPDLTEGTYLAFVGDDFTISTDDTHILRVRIEEVGNDGSAMLRLGPAGRKHVAVGNQVVLFRPPGSGTRELADLPDHAPVATAGSSTVLDPDAIRGSSHLRQSLEKLKRIAVAMHAFYEVHGCFPPATVTGPDGKPWHSWRVLLLPYLDEGRLHEKYSFDEPWDGPNNRQLLAKMPDVYRDRVHGANPKHYTHYAASTGPKAVLGVRNYDQLRGDPLRSLKTSPSIRFRDILDGTSNTILLGTVGPEQAIPWTKPVDVRFDETYPRPGEKGSFATPFETPRAGPVGAFAYADASVSVVPSGISSAHWKRLVQRSDGVEQRNNGGRYAPQDVRPDQANTRNEAKELRQAAFVEFEWIEEDAPRARLVPARPKRDR